MLTTENEKLDGQDIPEVTYREFVTKAIYCPVWVSLEDIDNEYVCDYIADLNQDYATSRIAVRQKKEGAWIKSYLAVFCSHRGTHRMMIDMEDEVALKIARIAKINNEMPPLMVETWVADKADIIYNSEEFQECFKKKVEELDKEVRKSRNNMWHVLSKIIGRK